MQVMMKLILYLLLYLFYSKLPAAIKTNGLYNNNHVPTVNSVPAPWTPIQITQNNQIINVECWDRKYIFNNSILPTQIYSRESALLSKPINVIIIVNGKALSFNQGSLRLTSKSDAVAEMEGTAKLNYADGVIEINSKIHIEYDGLMLISLTSNYPKNFKPGSITISISYNKAVSKYYVTWMKSNRNYSGSIALKNGLSIQSQFTPYFWIGDNDKGLFWFCESSQNWPNAENENAIQIFNNSDEVIQKFNLGNTSQYDFGIQATPVKPLPTNWRNLRFSPAINSNVVVPWPKPGDPSSTKYFGWPEPVNENNYDALIKKFQSNGKKVLSYIAITRLPSKLPIYQQNKNNWKLGKIPMTLKDDNLVYIEPASKNYSEIISHQLTYYLQKNKFDGYYLDGAKLYSGWVNNQNKNYYPILAYRELQRRLYDSIKSQNPNALIISHMSGNMVIPILAYVDGYVDGEQFRSGKTGQLTYNVKESYLDLINLDQFKAEFIGKQWGIIPFFLPEFDPASAKNTQPTLGLASLLLVHDVQPWPIFSNISVWNKMYSALDSFGFQKSTFVPYYSNNPPTVNNNLKGLYVSAYTKTGQALIIISNLSKNPISGKVVLNPSALGLNAITNAYSFTNNTQTNLNQNTVDVKIEPLSYQILWLK